jgi:hypothetical protein
MNVPDTQNVLHVIRRLFEDHGISFVESGDWLAHSSGHSVAAEASVRRHSETFATVRLDVDVALSDGRLMTESVVGIGDAEEKAFGDAIDSFAENTLHVMLTALFDYSPDDMVNVEKLDINGERWKVVAGSFGCRRSEKNAHVQVPDALYPAVEAAVRKSVLDFNCHWFRIFFSQLDGEPNDIELLMDNDEWVVAGEHIAKVKWEAAPGYYSDRLFLVVLRDPPLSLCLLEQDDAIKIGMDMVIDYWIETDISDIALFRRLTNAAVPADLAEKLIAFVPLGFSNVYLRGAELSSTYILFREDGRGPERPLALEPVFLAAQKRAISSPPKELRRIASRCALVDALKQTIDDWENVTPEGLKGYKFTAPIIALPRFGPPPAMRKR